MAAGPRTYGEFWLDYLGQHADGRSRALHYAGSLLALAALAGFVATGSLCWLAAAPLVGYTPAWLGHLAFERNTPATFRHPLYSLLSDYRMLGLWLVGRLAPELQRARLGARPRG